MTSDLKGAVKRARKAHDEAIKAYYIALAAKGQEGALPELDACQEAWDALMQAEGDLTRGEDQPMTTNLDRLLGVLKLTDPGDDALALLDRAREMLGYDDYNSFRECWFREYYPPCVAA